MQGLPWKWILEKILDCHNVNIHVVQDITGCIPDIEDQHGSSLQERIALRYLEDIVRKGPMDARMIPLVKALIRDNVNEQKLLLSVQTEASLYFLRGCGGGQERDWVGFANALGCIFSEDVEGDAVSRKAELWAVVKDKNCHPHCEEIFQKYPIGRFRRDLLQFIQNRKIAFNKSFLDELMRDVCSGVYNLSSAQTNLASMASEVIHYLELGDIHATEAQRTLCPEVTVHGTNKVLEVRSPSAMDGVKDAIFCTSLENRNGGTLEGQSVELMAEDVNGVAGSKGMSELLNEEMSLSCRLRESKRKKREESLLVDKHARKTKIIQSNSTSVKDFPSMKNSKNLSGVGAGFKKKPASDADKWQLEIDDDAGILDTNVLNGLEYFEVGRDGHEKVCHKCKKQGNMMFCFECPVAVHLECIEQSMGQIISDKDWYCPICNYRRACTAYYKARKAAALARECLSVFINPVGLRLECPGDLVGPDNGFNQGSEPIWQETASYAQDSPSNRSLIDKVSSRGKKAAAPDLNYEKDKSEPGNVNAADSHERTCSGIHLVQATSPQKEPKESHLPGSSPQGEEEKGFEKYQNRGPGCVYDFEGHESDPIDQFSKRVRHNIPGLRRKNLPWTKEEEEVLKEGIRLYSKGNGSWGFQWARILEYGYGKFHESRTSIDLKDKWRNLAKFSSWET